MPSEPEMGENANGAIFDSIFRESKVDKVISKYFEKSKKEIDENYQKKMNHFNHIMNIKYLKKIHLKLFDMKHFKVLFKHVFIEELKIFD
jgi:hypothetical protein